jgi:hypothetical protein
MPNAPQGTEGTMNATACANYGADATAILAEASALGITDPICCEQATEGAMIDGHPALSLAELFAIDRCGECGVSLPTEPSEIAIAIEQDGARVCEACFAVSAEIVEEV